jgi:hypothetical protein
MANTSRRYRAPLGPHPDIGVAATWGGVVLNARDRSDMRCSSLPEGQGALERQVAVGSVLVDRLVGDAEGDLRRTQVRVEVFQPEKSPTRSTPMPGMWRSRESDTRSSSWCGQWAPISWRP